MTAELSGLPPERELLLNYHTKLLEFTLTRSALIACNSFSISGESIIERQVKKQNLKLSKN